MGEDGYRDAREKRAVEIKEGGAGAVGATAGHISTLGASRRHDQKTNQHQKNGKDPDGDPGLSTWEYPLMGDQLVDFPTSGTMGGVLTSTMGEVRRLVFGVRFISFYVSIMLPVERSDK